MSAWAATRRDCDESHPHGGGQASDEASGAAPRPTPAVANRHLPKRTRPPQRRAVSDFAGQVHHRQRQPLRRPGRHHPAVSQRLCPAYDRKRAPADARTPRSARGVSRTPTPLALTRRSKRLYRRRRASDATPFRPRSTAPKQRAVSAAAPAPGSERRMEPPPGDANSPSSGTRVVRRKPTAPRDGARPARAGGLRSTRACLRRYTS